MKKIGLVGGLGWPGTSAYYGALCTTARTRFQGDTLAVTIESLDMSQTLAARGEFGDDDSWAAFDNIFVDAFGRLKQAGCDIAAIASATPHCRIASISQRTSLPIVSLIDATATALDRVKSGHSLVLGTTPTLRMRLFHDLLDARSIGTIGVRGEADNTSFVELLDAYFYCGRAGDGRRPLLDYCRERIGQPLDTVVVLGCTDLAPAFSESRGRILFDAEGMTFLDTMQAHVESILRAANE